MVYTRAQFIEKVGPLAQQDAKISKILASLTIAQAILESNDGNSSLTREGNALFGIKAINWRGKVWTGSTIEYYDGSRTSITAGFRAYDNWQDSISDHSTLLMGLSRYKAVVGETDYKKACQAIQAAGYATDPQYANKLIKLIEDNDLTKFDKKIVEVKDDSELFDAVRKIILNGINLNINAWKRIDLINLNNVPSLLNKIGGLDKLVGDKVISDRTLWLTNQYNANHVRSLLIKYASTIK